MSLHYRVHADPRSSHQQISRLVRELRLDPVLDVGCAQGMLAHLVKDANLTLDGVEYNPEWANIARPMYRQVWSGAIEDAPLPEKTYKLVVCGDVLEHTVNPVVVLERLKKAATDDAKFIISLPNVAHLAVRLMLLFGKFPKMERGILDKTHLHFFTRDTVKQMLQQAGLRAIRISATGVPLDELWKSGEGKLFYRFLMRSQHLCLSIAPRLFGFQWVILAERDSAKNNPHA